MAQIQLWVDLNHARAMRASSEESVCRILSRNMKVLHEMTKSKETLSVAQQLTVQAMQSSTAQVCRAVPMYGRILAYSVTVCLYFTLSACDATLLAVSEFG
jgi:hypothetical protein